MILMQCERDPRIQILGSLCLRDILCGMKRFVTADPHFLHKLVSELRGFDTPQAHDAHYIEVFNSHVGPDDQTWFLGDITLKPLEHAAHLIQALNGRKHLVLGNHDYAHPMSKRHSTKHFRQAVDLFDTVYQTGMWKGMEVPVLMSHFLTRGITHGKIVSTFGVCQIEVPSSSMGTRITLKRWRSRTACMLAGMHGDAQ